MTITTSCSGISISIIIGTGIITVVGIGISPYKSWLTIEQDNTYKLHAPYLKLNQKFLVITLLLSYLRPPVIVSGLKPNWVMTNTQQIDLVVVSR